jgi:signal transduction histidine kinase
MGAERLANGAGVTPKELTELANQLVSIARRAALMEAQVDLLEGKRKSAARLHDAIVEHAAHARVLAGLPFKVGSGGGGSSGSSSGGDSKAGNARDGGDPPGLEEGGPLPPGVSRMILTAQEDLRREIARQMHDGPAQSLTNIVLQAQIVDRLMTRAPEKAGAEVHQLIAMVLLSLEST